MSTTRGYYLPPSPGDVSRLEQLWRETPGDLNGVRLRFLSGGVRRMSAATVLKCRPDDLNWPSMYQRKRFRWPRWALVMEIPDPKWREDRAKWANLNSKYPSVADKPARKTKAQLEAERMEPSETDPTPEQIRAMALEIKMAEFKRMQGNRLALEIDLR